MPGHPDDDGLCHAENGDHECKLKYAHRGDHECPCGFTWHKAPYEPTPQRKEPW